LGGGWESELEGKLEVGLGEELVRLWGLEWWRYGEEQQWCSTQCPPRTESTNLDSQPCRWVGS
jgi:hypothetical protein